MKLLVALVAVVGLAACSSGHNTSSGPPSTTSRAPRTAVRTVPSTATRPQPLSTRIELVTSIIAGRTVTGHLVVDNNTGKPLQLVSSDGCYPEFAVALGNDKIPPQAAFGASCTTGQAFVIPVGESRYAFSSAPRTSGAATLAIRRAPNPRAFRAGVMCRSPLVNTGPRS